MNERRTRRGVYLVMPEQQGDSDDSDEDEDMMSSSPVKERRDLSAAMSSIASSPMKEIVDLTNSNSSTPQQVRTLRSRSSATNSAANSLSPEKTPVKSLLSTRGQKAREDSLSSGVSQLQTPPIASLSLSTPTRSQSEVFPKGKGSSVRRYHAGRSTMAPLVQESASCPPASKRRGRPPKNASAVVVKVEETEVSLKTDGRVLRTRPSVTNLAVPKPTLAERVHPQQKPAPSVPSCVNCLTPLPLTGPGAISPRKGKSKDTKEECSR